jgi:general secretion pathway protein D
MQKFCNARSVCWVVLLFSLVGAQAPAAAQGAAPPIPSAGAAGDAGQTAGGHNEAYPGSGQGFAPSAAGAPGVDQQGDITLNFVNADVRDVAKAILGDYLKLNYEIGANVQGLVTIQTNEPLSRAQVLPALEQGLSLNGMALVRANDVYKIVPLADVHRELGAAEVATGRATPSGYGVEVFRLKYVSAADLLKVLQPLAGAENSIRVDQSRNLLIVEGTATERQTIAEDIALFDVDWLSGMSFALYTPENLDADELAKELDQVIGGLNSPVAGVVRLVPIERLNAVLAIAPQIRYLDQLRAWVTRLDMPGQGNDKKIFVYHVQNGRATDLANTLRKTLFGGDTSTSQDTTVTTQINQPSSTQSGGGLSSLGSSSGGATPFGSSSGSAQFGSSSDQLTSPRTGSQEAEAPSHEQPTGAAARFETIGGVNREGVNSIHITADETNNALAILATAREYAMIENALHQLDTAPVQVLLEASIAEVTLTKEMQYGVQYLYDPGSTLAAAPTPASTIAASFTGFSYLFAQGTNIQVVLNALGTKTHVNVISSPEVLVLNNQAARLEVGDQVPVLQAQAISTITSGAPVVNSVQYIDTGVILKVTPRVNRGGVVMMDISQEVSGVDDSATSAIGSPTIQQRKINSTVSVEDGETITLGGLFTNQVSKGDSGLPFLEDIPYLGHLFKTTTDSQTKDELMVLITPHVVDNVQKARAVTDELRKKFPELQPLFSQHG